MNAPRRAALAISLCSIALGACGGREAAEPEPALVRTAAVGKASLTRWLSLNGRVSPRPDRDAILAPRVAGRLLSIHVREGDSVRAGQLLAGIDTAALDDAVSAARAVWNRHAADARFRRSVAVRSVSLLTKGVISREQSDSDEAAAAAAEASREEAAAALAIAGRERAWATVTAPFDGAVMHVLRRAGESVDGTPATPVVEIAAPEPCEVAAAATAESLALVSPGQAAEIVLSGTAPKAEAKVVSVGRAVDPATGAGEVRLQPDRSDRSLALGTSVEVRIALETRHDVIVVPAEALRATSDGGVEVVVVEGGVAHVRKVEKGITEDGRVEITTELAAGSRVVVEDPLGLAEGIAVHERP
jgi:RND family efflux transporter MFP subunit